MGRKLVEDYIPFENFEIVDDIDHINESAQSEVAQSKGAILAIVKGPHFVPNGISRNRRNYKDVWDEVSKDEDVRDKVQKCQMLGRIGHDAEMTDMDIAEAQFSHYTRAIDWKTGIAESVILNTPMGNTLLTLLRAKVTMYVSSRADGEYCGKDEDGNDIMDPKSYKLERFDFVQDPGFLDAHPEMVTESKQNKNKSADSQPAGSNEEADKEFAAKHLLELARDTKTQLRLDGKDYVVEAVMGNDVTLGDINEGHYENLHLSDFTEVLEAMKSSLRENFASTSQALEESQRTIETLRFANKNGLDESYVVGRRKVGESFETIAQSRPQPPAYTVKSAKDPVNESFKGSADDEAEPFVTRLWGK